MFFIGILIDPAKDVTLIIERDIALACIARIG